MIWQLFCKQVIDPPTFAISKAIERVNTTSLFADPDRMKANGQTFVVNTNYRISPLKVLEDGTNPSKGTFKDIRYTVESAPDGWFVGAENGEISGVFSATGPQTIKLFAVDKGNQKALVEEYKFDVQDPPTFTISTGTTRVSTSNEFTDPDMMKVDGEAFIVNTSYRISPLRVLEDGTEPSKGGFKDITYKIEDAPPGWFVSNTNGEITGVFSTTGPQTMKLFAVDRGNQKALVEEYTFDVQPPPVFQVAAFRHYMPENKTFDFSAGDPISNDAGASASNRFAGTSPAARGLQYYDERLPKTHTNTSRQLVYFNTTVQLPPIRILDPPAQNVTFTVEGMPDGFYINPNTCEILGRPVEPGETTTATVFAINQGGQRALLETIEFKVVLPDTGAGANGPHEQTCQNGGVLLDGRRFDSAFTCKCSANCIRATTARSTRTARRVKSRPPAAAKIACLVRPRAATKHGASCLATGRAPSKRAVFAASPSSPTKRSTSPAPSRPVCTRLRYRWGCDPCSPCIPPRFNPHGSSWLGWTPRTWEICSKGCPPTLGWSSCRQPRCRPLPRAAVR